MKKLVNPFENRWIPKVLSLLVAILLSLFYQVNNKQERFLTIPLKIELHEGMAINGREVSHVKVQLTSSEDKIFDAVESDFQAIADFTSFQNEGTFKVPIKIELNKDSIFNAKNIDIKLSPENLTIFQEKKITKKVNIKPHIINTPSHGYEMIQYYLSPNFTRIEGPASQVKPLADVQTEEIDLAGRSDSFSQTYKLKPLGRNLEFASNDRIEFRGVIDPITEVKTFKNIEIISLDINESLRLQETLPTLSITLQGNQIVLDQLKKREIQAYVDCSSVEWEGTYSLPLEVQVPKGVTVMKFDPVEINLSFKNRPKSGEQTP